MSLFETSSIETEEGDVIDTTPSLTADKSLRPGYYTKAYSWWLRAPLPSSVKTLYLILASYAGAGESCYPGVKRLCNELGVADNKLKQSMDMLVEMGIVEVKRRGLGLCNLYHLHDVANLESQISRFLNLENRGTFNEFQNRCDNDSGIVVTTIELDSGLKLDSEKTALPPSSDFSKKKNPPTSGNASSKSLPARNEFMNGSTMFSSAYERTFGTKPTIIKGHAVQLAKILLNRGQDVYLAMLTNYFKETAGSFAAKAGYGAGAFISSQDKYLPGAVAVAKDPVQAAIDREIEKYYGTGDYPLSEQRPDSRIP